MCDTIEELNVQPSNLVFSSFRFVCEHVCMCVCMCVCMSTYREREREREKSLVHQVNVGGRVGGCILTYEFRPFLKSNFKVVLSVCAAFGRPAIADHFIYLFDFF